MEFQYTITLFGEGKDSLQENFVRAYDYDFRIYENFAIYRFNSNPIFEFIKKSLSKVSKFCVEAYSEDEAYLICHSNSGECEVSYKLNDFTKDKEYQVIKILMGEDFSEMLQSTENPSCPITARIPTEKELAVTAYLNEIMTGGTF